MVLNLCARNIRTAYLKLHLLNSQNAKFLSRTPAAYSANETNSTGAIYDKKSIRVKLEAGKQLSWCSCGRSKKQPFCDGTHKDPTIKQRPIRFQVEETKEYSLCLCKQTKNKPFCDGTHKSKAIQEASAIVK